MSLVHLYLMKNISRLREGKNMMLYLLKLLDIEIEGKRSYENSASIFNYSDFYNNLSIILILQLLTTQYSHFFNNVSIIW